MVSPIPTYVRSTPIFANRLGPAAGATVIVGLASFGVACTRAPETWSPSASTVNVSSPFWSGTNVNSNGY